MPLFAYRAVDLAGSRSRGTLDAPDRAAVARELDARGFFLLEAVPSTPAESPSPVRLRGRVRRSDVAEATRAMASLLRAGLPLSRSLETASGVASGPVSVALDDVRTKVERGADLHEAMGAHPRVFSPLYTGLVRAGDRSGDLEGAFERLAEHLERAGALRSRLLSALIYPMLLAVVGAVAVVILLLFVIPRFAGLLTATGAALPTSTALMLGLADGLRSSWPAVLTASAGGVAAVVWFLGSDRGRAALAGASLRLPLVGRFERNLLAAQFARLTGSLLDGGAPLLGALDDTVESTWNPAAKEAATAIREEVREGSSLGAALAASNLYPPLLAELVHVGEESGALNDFLLKAAEIFESRTEHTLERLVSVAEPAMIVAFGVIVGLIALSLLQAVYGINAGLVP
jgi:type II secretory pathway component PulF